MSPHSKKQNLYCFVDETGQDAGSAIFIVVAITVTSNLDSIRTFLQDLEQAIRITKVKWHKAKHEYRINFLKGFLREGLTCVGIYFMKTKKPIPYYVPTLDVLQRVITEKRPENGQAIIYIDGLDALSAKKFTNALRTKFIRVRLAKGVRDEGESLIRLADRWAGCIRMALSGNKQCQALVEQAQSRGLLQEI
jgi:hypothetical protein